jgi:hypothetical protein
MSQPAFDFGQNWKEFSENALDPAHYAQAQAHFAELMAGIPLGGADFLMSATTIGGRGRCLEHRGVPLLRFGRPPQLPRIGQVL